jgi:hypothetical protein
MHFLQKNLKHFPALFHVATLPVCNRRIELIRHVKSAGNMEEKTNKMSCTVWEPPMKTSHMLGLPVTR